MPKKNEDLDKKEKSPSEEESPRLFRRLLDTGLDVLIGEEGERPTLKPLTIPKEVLSYLFNQIDKSKSEIVSLFGREFKRFLEATDVSEEIVKAMSQLSIEVKAEVNFKKASSDDEKTSKKDKKRTTKIKISGK